MLKQFGHLAGISYLFNFPYSFHFACIQSSKLHNYIIIIFHITIWGAYAPFLDRTKCLLPLFHQAVHRDKPLVIQGHGNPNIMGDVKMTYEHL